MLKHYFINATMKGVGSLMNYRFEQDTRNCVQAQEETLLSLIQENMDTVYGRDHSFSQILSRNDFVRLHPLTEYSHYEPYIDRVYNGEEGVMTKKMPVMFGVTSGTSGQCKLMPTCQRLFTSFFIHGITVLYYQMFRHFPSVNELQKDMKFFYSPKFRTSPSGLLV
jgi:hypothetical protein